MSSPLLVVVLPLLSHCHLLLFSQCACLRLAMHCCLLSTSPPGPLSFVNWLSCPISLRRLHFMSLFVAMPPHVSILYPLPLFVPTGCQVTSICTASATRPLVNTTAPQHATTSHRAVNSTSRLPLVCPNWLPRCLLWHLRLTCASLPSPLPLPLVASCSCLPQLVIVLSAINLELCVIGHGLMLSLSTAEWRNLLNSQSLVYDGDRQAPLDHSDLLPEGTDLDPDTWLMRHKSIPAFPHRNASTSLNRRSFGSKRYF
jgi:hypothetical protein